MIHGNIVIICLCLSVSNPLTLMSSVVMKVMMMMRFILMTYHPVTHLSLRMFFCHYNSYFIYYYYSGGRITSMYGHEDPTRVPNRPNLQPITEERSE